jgi:hypothetical protein
MARQTPTCPDGTCPNVDPGTGNSAGDGGGNTGNTGDPGSGNGAQYTPSDLMMYFTSRSAPGCKPVDDRIQAMKDEGWPIVVTRLSSQDAQVQGVPRLYIPSKDKHVVGISNCRVYLSTLVKR